jgi:hypothetical protein
MKVVKLLVFFSNLVIFQILVLQERFFVQTRAVNEEIDQNWKYLFDRALKGIY